MSEADPLLEIVRHTEISISNEALVSPINVRLARLIVDELLSHEGETIDAILASTIGNRILEVDLSLVGVAESAEVLEVSKQRIGQLINEGKMPNQVAHLRATPVWFKEDIEMFHYHRKA